ncbi:MAG: WD40/YVTN/BNR-like repeat-containing protein, partial [Flavisolibacter sp.]
MHFRTLILALTLSTLFGTGCQLKKSENKSEEEETVSERDQMEKAMEQEFMMTVDPVLGYIPKERMITALNYERRLIALRGSGINAFTWQERGPNNIAGRTRAILIDSRDATGNTVFAASVSGGIWKATNFKTSANPTWTPVNESMGSLAVCALAQDPSNPNTIYAGTGEGWFNSDAVRGNGIWKTTDGGSTWNKLPSTDSTTSSKAHNFDFVQDIVVNSQGVVFAACRSVYCNAGGVFRSGDNGTTWTRVIGTQTSSCSTSTNLQGTDLEIASNGDVYACVGMTNDFPSQNGHIFRSSASNGSNVGTLGTWTDITPSGTWQRIEIAVAPSNPATVYALLEGTGDGIGAIKKSTNSGASWTDLPLPQWCNQGSNSNDFTNGQAFYDLIAQVDPNNENNVVIGGIDLFKSTNGGTTWTQFTQWARNCSSLPVVHADQHNFLFFPSSSTDVVATNDGGIYYSSNAGASFVTHTIPNLNGANQTTISDKNVGYNVTQFYACDLHPTQTNYMLAGCQDNGTLQFTTAGMNTTTEVSVGGDGGYSHIDQLTPTIQVAFSAYNNIYYSRNGGTSFSSLLKFNDNGQFINPSDYDDVKKMIYSGYVAGQLGVISNMASGTPTFSGVVVTGMSGLKVSAVKVDPTVSAGGTVWFAAYDSTRSAPPTIFKMTNVSGGTPVVTTPLNAVPNGSYVSSIDVDPANANHILLTLSNYGIESVFESTNGGASFSNVEGNLPDVPVRWGMFVPASASIDGTTPGGILLGTEVGVWSTLVTAGTATVWTPQNSGLPNVRTDMLRFRGSDGLLAAA